MVEARLPCPVCAGVKMVKRSPPGADHVVLDLCPRCGGLWFEKGEVQAVRSSSSRLPEPGAGVRSEPGRCPACHAVVSRDAAECPACGHEVVIDCPECAEPMRVETHRDLTLDVCTRCHGVWFDQHEVAALWSLALGSAALSRAMESRAASGVSTGDGGLVLLDALHAAELLAYSPEVGLVVVEGAARTLSALGELISHAPEVLGVVAEAAAATFEVLLEAVAAILGGLS